MSTISSGTHDIRPFEKAISNSIFTVLPNRFETELTLFELSPLSCDPTGMAWGTDNSTLYFSDGHTKNITKCEYDPKKADVSNCTTMVNVAEDISDTAVPKGMATDENNHLWVAIADEEYGSIIEFDTQTSAIISTIGNNGS